MNVLDLLRQPQVRVRVARHFDIAAPDADGMVTFFSAAFRLAAAPHDAAYGDDLLRLRDGVALAGLRDAVLRRAGPGAAGRLLFQLGQFGMRGLLRYEVVDGDRVLATLMPQKTSYIPRVSLPAPGQKLVLSRFALVRREDDQMLLESPRAAVRVALDDPAAAALVHGFGRPSIADEVADTPGLRTLTGFLFAAGLLVAADAAVVTRFEEGGPVMAQWEFHDLLFHARSRRGSTHDAFGGIFPYLDIIEPLPAVRPTWPGDPIPLARPDLDALTAGDWPLTAVQELRRSVRTFDETNPITLEQLGHFLFRTARLKARSTIDVANPFGTTGTFEISWRPYPTGGASYDLELYIVADRCQGLASGLYHYDPEGHALARVSERTAEVERMLADSFLATAAQARGQVLLVMAARFQRVSWKYRAMAYAVTLRNAGSLYQTMYLVATAMGLAPCGIGTSDSEVFARATGLDPTVEGPVGEFILGSLPRPPA